jgi:hypothetical protein
MGPTEKSEMWMMHSEHELAVTAGAFLVGGMEAVAEELAQVS